MYLWGRGGEGGGVTGPSSRSRDRDLESYCRAAKCRRGQQNPLPSPLLTPEESVLSHVNWLLQQAGQTDSNSNVTFFPPLDSESQTVCKATGLFLVFAGGRGKGPRRAQGHLLVVSNSGHRHRRAREGRVCAGDTAAAPGGPPWLRREPPPQAHCPSCLHSGKTGQGLHQKGEDMWAMLLVNHVPSRGQDSWRSERRQGTGPSVGRGRAPCG